MYMNTYSNERFSNVPLTAEQFDVIDFIAFESETSVVYPFEVAFDDVTFEMVNEIVCACDGSTNDNDILYYECESVLGVNPELLK